MTKLTRLETFLFIALIASGCGIVDNAMTNDKYLIVSAVHYTKKYLAFPDEEKDEILFTLRHGRTTIVAHCQTWDVKNNCAQLKVGQDYEMKREGQGFDTLSIDDRHIVLAVEKETLER
jgi:hypothetical protein